MNWRKQGPTERQLEVLQEHGISVPPGCDRGEASRLIGLAYHGPAHAVYVHIAQQIGIDTSVERSRDDLLALIADELFAPGSEDTMCQWYAYRAYRRHIGHQRDELANEFNHPSVLAATRDLMATPGATTSVRRSLQCGGIMQFSATPHDQATASTNTTAYRTAIAAFRRDLSHNRRAVAFAPSPPTTTKPIPFPRDRGDRYSRGATPEVTPLKGPRSQPGEIPAAWLSPDPALGAASRRRNSPKGLGDITAGFGIVVVIGGLIILMVAAVFN